MGKKSKVAKAVKAVEKKVEKKAAKAETKAIVKAIEAKPFIAPIPKQIKQHAPKEWKKARVDPVFMEYFSTLIDPDRENYVGVPDGYPVPTGVCRSVQTIDVIANFNSTSVANADGGRFSFHIAPNAGLGQSQNDGYLQINQPYYNISSDNLIIENILSVVLGTKCAAILPNVAWAPGYVNSAVTLEDKKKNKKDKEKEKSSDVPKKPSKYERSGKDLTSDPAFVSSTNGSIENVRKNSRIRAGKLAGHRLESDFNNSAYEYWVDPLSAQLAGPSVDGIGDVAGAISMIRPVAMSVWFQCSKSSLDNAGSVAACLLPAGSTYGQVIPIDWVQGASADSFTGYGPLQDWENLAQVPGSYQGKLKDGTYSFWVPQRVSDTQMESLARSDIVDYPTIMVSGQWAPNAGEVADATSSLIGRLRIVTIYEYTSQQQLLQQRYQGCSPNFLERTKVLLHGQNTSMANGQHAAWIKKALATAAGGIIGLATAGPAGALEGAAMGYAAGKKWSGA